MKSSYSGAKCGSGIEFITYLIQWAENLQSPSVTQSYPPPWFIRMCSSPDVEEKYLHLESSKGFSFLTLYTLTGDDSHLSLFYCCPFPLWVIAAVDLEPSLLAQSCQWASSNKVSKSISQLFLYLVNWFISKISIRKCGVQDEQTMSSQYKKTQNIQLSWCKTIKTSRSSHSEGL